MVNTGGANPDQHESGQQQREQQQAAAAAGWLSGEGLLLGRYQVGQTLGAGNFGKVKLARNAATSQLYAIKILDRKRVLSLRFDDQIKREIYTLKLLRHPNVIRLHEVAASKTKIYMVMEYVDGGELFDTIEKRGKLSETEARFFFHQLIDGVSYCHEKGVFHRDLKPENVLLTRRGRVKISDFGLSALPQQFGNDGLLHTTCGSPNYIAPEVLANRGYDGAMSDVWSCGVVLYVMLVGELPFDDRNLVVLYQKIIKAEVDLPEWLSPDARDFLRRILDPNPSTRIDIAGIREHRWFKQNYKPAEVPYDDDDDASADTNTGVAVGEAADGGDGQPAQINAFELIGMASSLDLSGFFEDEDVANRRIRFASSHLPRETFSMIAGVATEMGLHVRRGKNKLNLVQHGSGSGSPQSQAAVFIVAAEVFELTPSLFVVELRKSRGDSVQYSQLCTKLAEALAAPAASQSGLMFQRTLSLCSKTPLSEDLAAASAMESRRSGRQLQLAKVQSMSPLGSSSSEEDLAMSLL